MEQTWINIEVLKYLSLSLSPVIIIGIWVLVVKIFSKKNKKNDESESREL